MASITVRPVDGRNTRASRLCMPQSSPADPFSRYGSERGGTDGENRPPSVRLSLSASGLPFGGRRRAVGRLGAGRPPERVEQSFLGQGQQPRVEPLPGG